MPDLRLSSKIAVLIAIEILLITASFAYLASYESNFALMGNSINIAGKNRFLTANVLLESEYYAADHRNAKSVEGSLQNLKSNIILLRQGGQAGNIELQPLPTNFIPNWQGIYENWVAFEAETKKLISSGNITEEDKILSSSQLELGNNLIKSSDSLVIEIAEYDKETSRQITALEIGLGILNIVVHFIMLYLIVRILKPIKLLTKAADAIGEGNLNISVAQGASAEFRKLGDSFNSMVKSLRESSHILAMEKKRYQELYDGAPDLYRMVDRKGILLDCNNAYFKSLGYSDKNELIGKSIFETTAEGSLNVMRECFDTWKKNGIVENVEIWLKRKDGSTFPGLISATAAVVYHGNREIVASNTCIIDVTKMHKARRELEEANMRLTEANKMKIDFILVASHELRTPIQPILAYCDLGLKGLVDPKKALQVIYEQAQRLKHLANDILDTVRIEGEILTLYQEQFSVNEIIQNIVHERTASTSKDVQIKLGLAANDDVLTIKADKQRIVQVLTNLLENAIKFTKNGSIEVSTRGVYDGRYIEICVSDTGAGIPPEILPRLFAKFATNSVNKGAEHGTGLGLFLCKGIVRAHGGSIIGYNNSTRGATFKIWLPTSKDQLKYQVDQKDEMKLSSTSSE